jgi:peptide/nickel transport system substrate-binding protein
MPPGGMPPGGAPPPGGMPSGGAPPSMGSALPWSSIDVIDDYTVRVNFTKWDNTIPYSFADASNLIFMVSKASYDKNGLDWMKSHPVGTGPFKFASFQQDVSIKFERNPDYWIQGKPYLDGLEYTLVADPMTRATIMMAGDEDMTTAEVGQTAVRYESAGIIVKINIELNNYLIPDTVNADSPWTKKEVREAAEYAIDREAISKGLGFGYTKAPYQIPPRGCSAYDPNFTGARKYDPEKAKELLAQAGYSGGFKTTLIASPLGVDKDVCVAMQGYLAKVGIQAELDFPEIGRWITYQYPGSWPKNSIVFQGIPMTDITFTQGLQFMFGVVGQSWARPPEVLQAFDKALAAPSPDVNLVRAVTDIMSRDALLIPVTEGGAGTAIRPYVMDAGILERGSSITWNAESAWLNK